ncbi:MAG: SDR family NAD(P)-dependent oxidoreductase [Myxococcota bacterium]
MGTPYQTALITGASSGIGREMALWWARRGTKVYAAARRTSLLEELAKQGEGNIEPVALDVSKESETVRRIQSLDEAVGGLELVIANAGVGGATPGDLATWEQVEAVLKVNVSGAAATLTAVLPRMVRRGKGHVVGVSSAAGYFGAGAYSSYCASKAFLSVFLQSLRVDLVGTGVKVTTIEPGFVKSEMTDKNVGRVPMPFRAETHVAADTFCRAIARGARTVSYPRVHAISSKLISLVPSPIFEPLARKASEPQRQGLTSGEER